MGQAAEFKTYRVNKNRAMMAKITRLMIRRSFIGFKGFGFWVLGFGFGLG